MSGIQGCEGIVEGGVGCGCALPGISPSFQPQIAKTLPPTFHTSDPPHCVTWVAAGRPEQKRLNSSRVMACLLPHPPGRRQQPPSPAHGGRQG